ncbi:MAG: metallophosphoesterase [Phycisphaerales bacterium]|nr:metallophosphoesterase [Phycisphaerales bacterium]
MTMKRGLMNVLGCLGALSIAASAMGQASLTASGYTENFDSMGTSGTTPPTGWKHLSFNMTTSNGTWTNATGILASGTTGVSAIAVGTASTTLAASAGIPTAANNNGYNAPLSAGTTADRVIGTSPTNATGAGIQLQLNNNTGAALPTGSTLSVAFDTVRYNAASAANELPGYWLFVSLDAGTTWTNVTPNPTITTVPNTIGVSASTLTVTLPATWNTGASLYFRWVDDNAAQSSPDQTVGLNNVVVTVTSVGDLNGKCCSPATGACALTTTGACAAGSTFTPGGVCDPNTCPPPPTGTCCAVTGSCTSTTQIDCAAGSVWTVGNTCAANPCPVLSVSLTSAGYAQNFNALGQTGTTPPAGWSCRALSGSHDEFSFAGSLATITSTNTPAQTPTAINSGVAGNRTLTTNNTLVAVNNPTTQASATQCFNVGASSGDAAGTGVDDRCLASAPTGNAANQIQLSLTNDSGASLSAVNIAYDIRRFRTTANNNTGFSGPDVGLEEFPGYWLFYSLDGGTTWSNVATLNPTKTGPDGVIVPNSVGITAVTFATVSFPAPVAQGAPILFRWVDDNAQSPSPDQLIGLDNVQIVTVDPASLGACCLADGSCILTDDDSCPGTIFTPFTACSAVTCPQPPTGGCCAIDGSCLVTTQSGCTAGTWSGSFTCTPNNCPGPQVACCLPDGSCTLTDQGACSGFAVTGRACSAAAICRPANTTRFVAFGDYGVDNSNQASVASRMRQYNPEFMVTTGDNTYNTSTAVSNYDNTQAKYYGPFMRVGNSASAYFAQYSANAVNFYPTMGNHDIDIGGGASASIPYFLNYFAGLPLNAGQPKNYYTFSRGPIDFFCLSSDPREPDSNAAGGVQYQWFINAYNASIARGTAKYRIVFFHHPPYTNPSTHGPDTTLQGWNLQNLTGLTAVLNGHNHNMQRLNINGVRFFVTGAGGNSLYSISSAASYNEFFNASNFGFLLVDASDAGITFRFVTDAGNVIDTYAVTNPGACCLADGSCISVASSTACSGTFRGAGTVCSAANCPLPAGACCLADGSCITAASSTACSGTFRGAGSVCSSANCPQPVGACCQAAICTVVAQAQCSGSATRFAGAGTVCNVAGNNVLPCCRADFDQSGTRDVSDIFAFLSAWFADSPQADLDGGGRNVQDIFTFLSLWFAGC